MSIICIQSLLSTSTFAEEVELLNRPLNLRGYTGLFVTTAPYTLPAGTIEAGYAVNSENSYQPYFTLTEYPLFMTAGIGKHMELGVRADYVFRKEGAAVKERGFGDLELLYKWMFMPQQEYSFKPALAIIASGIVPLQESDTTQMSSVAHWGGKIGLTIGSDIYLGDYVLALCADGQVVVQDLSDTYSKDVYGIVNAGILFPVSKYRHLQMLLEYTVLNGKNRLSIYGGDYSAMTYGLRLVNERFNFTIGTQFIHKEIEGYDNSGRVTGMMSMKF